MIPGICAWETCLTEILVGSMDTIPYIAVKLGWAGLRIRYLDEMGGCRNLIYVQSFVAAERHVSKKGYTSIIAHHAFRYLAATPLGKFLALNSTPFTLRISAFTFATASSPPCSPDFPPECVELACGSFSRYARSSLMLSPSGFDEAPSVGRRSESLPCIPKSALAWSWVGERGASESEDVEEVERDRRGEVCVPAERLKKRAPSEPTESVSEPSSFGRGGLSGILDAALSSFLLNASMFAPALSNSECRAVVRLSSMGSTMCLLVP